MVGWTDELLQKRLDNAHDATILDLGTGNGSFLFALSSLGYKNLSGCDYSEQSIFFAKAIAKKRAISNIHWIHDDLLDSKIGSRQVLILILDLFCTGVRFDFSCLRFFSKSVINDMLLPF